MTRRSTSRGMVCPVGLFGVFRKISRVFGVTAAMIASAGNAKSGPGGTRITARAFFVADRINTQGLERGDVLSTAPLAFRVNENGVAILFRFGVVVLIGLNALEEDEFLRGLQHRMTGAFARREEEAATIEISSDKEEQIPPGGPICLQSLSPERR